MTDFVDPKTERKEIELGLKRLELEKAQLELENLRADTASKQAERREKVASAEKTELSLEATRQGLARESVRNGLMDDSTKGIFRLEAPVYEHVLDLTAIIERYAAAHPGADITLHLFSPGGSVFHGLALYDALRTLSDKGHKITTVIRGFAGSMASVIFLAGDVRRIGQESLIHQHEPSSVALGKASELREESEFVGRLYEKLTRIYVTRTSISRTQFRKLTTKREWFADSDEALKYRIATEIG